MAVFLFCRAPLGCGSQLMGGKFLRPELSAEFLVFPDLRELGKETSEERKLTLILAKVHTKQLN